MIDKKTMMNHIYNQLAIDYNCSPDDFLRDGLIFTEAKQSEGRRPYPWVTPRLEIISFGRGVVINATADILPLLRAQAEGMTRDEAFWAPFVYGPNLYFLPDVNRFTPMANPDGFVYECVEEHDIPKLYAFPGFDYVLHYGDISPWRYENARKTADIDKIYAVYYERFKKDAEKLAQADNIIIPVGFDPSEVKGILIESAQKLKKIKPKTLGAASRIPGVTPADINLLMVHIERFRHEKNK